MGVRFACHACQRRLNVKSELAGKKGKCPSCGSRFRIPASDSDFSIPLTSDRPASADAQGASSKISQKPLPVQRAIEPAPDQPSTEQPSTEQPSTEPPISEPPTTEPPTPEPPAPEPPAPEPPTSDESVSDTAGEPGSAQAAADQVSQPVPAPPPAPPLAPPPAPTPKDLLEADPAALWYVRPPSGGQYGPATGRLLKEWIGEGRVAAASLLWREGWAQWRRAEEVVPDLLSSLEAPAAIQSTEAAAPPTATAGAGIEQSISGEAPAMASESPDAKEEFAAPANQTPPPGRIKRQRKSRRVMIIGILVGLSILLLIVLIVVLVSGLGG